MRALLITTIALLVIAAPAAARQPAPGAPGSAPTWLPSDKHGFGTAAGRDPASPVWFTLRRSSMSEAYYPDLSTPSIRSLEFAVTNANGRGAELDSDQAGSVERVDGLTFRQTVT